MSMTGHAYDHAKTVYAASGGFNEQTMTLDWSVTLTGTQDDIISGKALPKLDLSGTTSWQGSSDQGVLSCTGGLHAAKHIPQSTLQTLLFIEPPNDTNPSVNYNQGVGPPNTANSENYLLEAEVPASVVVSDNTNPHDSQCNTGPAYLLTAPPSGSAESKQYAKAASPVAIVHPDGSVDNGTNSYSHSGPTQSPTGTTTTEQTKVSTSLSWGGCQAGTKPASTSNAGARLMAFHEQTTGGSVCPAISWTNAPGGAKVVSDDNVTAEAGEPITVEGSINGSVVANSDQPKWTITGPAIKNYVIEDKGAHEEPLTAADRTSIGFTFFWTKAGSYVVQLEVKGKTVPANFKVTAPTESFHAKTCEAGIDTEPSERTTGASALTPPIFGLGIVNQLLVNGKTVASNKCTKPAGIEWTAETDGTGKIAITQLVKAYLKHNGHDCTAASPTSDYAADNHKFYLGKIEDAHYLNTSDSPGLSLQGRNGSYTYAFYGHDYLMFQPEAKGSIWIPLSYMDWSFTETVSLASGGKWKIDATGNPSPKIAGVHWEQEPTWTQLDNNLNGWKC
jgi:hypothetical protein